MLILTVLSVRAVLPCKIKHHESKPCENVPHRWVSYTKVAETEFETEGFAVHRLRRYVGLFFVRSYEDLALIKVNSQVP